MFFFGSFSEDARLSFAAENAPEKALAAFENLSVIDPNKDV